jgi:hypothetical protein
MHRAAAGRAGLQATEARATDDMADVTMEQLTRSGVHTKRSNVDKPGRRAPSSRIYPLRFACRLQLAFA